MTDNKNSAALHALGVIEHRLRAIDGVLSFEHEYETIRDALTKEAAQLEWMPIETAPKSNGHQAFLVYIKGHGCCVACRLECGTFYNYSKRMSLGQSGRLENMSAMTHWMPLPKPPAIRAAQQNMGEE